MPLKEVFNPLSGNFDLVNTSLVFNVQDYGAVGDGTTDDQTAFQAAITAAQASGGTVLIPGNFNMLVSGAPTITAGNVMIQGLGWSSKITLATAALNASGTTIGIWVNGTSNVIIKDLCIDGNFANIAKNGTFQASSTLWDPIRTKYGTTSVKGYIYAVSGVDQSTYLTYRMPIRITDSSKVIVENCLIQNSVSAGIMIDATIVDNSQEIIIRNNRVTLTWDNGIYFHKGVRYGSAIGNHCSDTQYAGVCAIYCNDMLVSDNVIHDNGPSSSDSAGVEYCGVNRGIISDNTIYNSLFEGILLKNTNETGITNGFSNNYVRNYSIKISDNHITNIHDPRFGSSIAYGINIRSADKTQVIGNHVELADYGIQVGDVAEATIIQDNHVNYSYGTGIVIGNSADVTNTKVIGNTIENGASSGVWAYAQVDFRDNIVRNNDQEGIDLIAPPTGIPYKTDTVENNLFMDNGFNGVHPEAGAGNMAVVKNNEFRNSDTRTWNDGVSASSTTFTSATASFASTDVGNVMIIMGVGNSSGSDTLTTKVASVTNSTTVVLSNATGISRTGVVFTMFRAKNVYYDAAMSGTTTLTSATANFTSSDVGKTVVLYSSDGPFPSVLSSLTVATYVSATQVTLSGSPGTFTGRQFVIKRGYGRMGRAFFVSNSSDIHYEGNRSIGMSTENYNNGSLSINSVLKNNYDIGSATSNQDPLLNPITPIANSQNFTAFPGQKDSVFQMNAVSGALSAFLPDTSTITKGSIYTIKKIDASVNAVTVFGTNSQTFDGASSYVLSVPQQSAVFISNGSNWEVQADYNPNVNTPVSPTLLATVTGINAKSTGQTTLYTVPTGKTCVVTAAIIRCTAASSITNGPTASVGFTSTAYTDIYAAANMVALTGTTSIFGYSTVGMSASAVAATVIKFNISSAASGTSQTIAVDLIGYLF